MARRSLSHSVLTAVCHKDCCALTPTIHTNMVGRALYFFSLFEKGEGLIRGVQYFFDDGPPKPARRIKKIVPYCAPYTTKDRTPKVQ